MKFQIILKASHNIVKKAAERIEIANIINTSVIRQKNCKHQQRLINNEKLAFLLKLLQRI